MKLLALDANLRVVLSLVKEEATLPLSDLEYQRLQPHQDGPSPRGMPRKRTRPNIGVPKSHLHRPNLVIHDLFCWIQRLIDIPAHLCVKPQLRFQVNQTFVRSDSPRVICLPDFLLGSAAPSMNK